MRAVRAGEQQPLRELRVRAIAQAPEAFGETPAQVLAHPQSDWENLAGGIGVDGGEVGVYVALDSARWVALAAGGWFDRPRQIVQLWSMWVEPELRGQGIGERLVGSVRGWASLREARFVRLGVIEDSPAIAFYERLGFVDTGERKRLTRDPRVTAIYMARPA